MAIVLALVFDPRFRDPRIGGDGEPVLGILSVRGAAFILLAGLLIGAVLFLLRDSPAPLSEQPERPTQSGVDPKAAEAFEPKQPPSFLTATEFGEILQKVAPRANAPGAERVADSYRGKWIRHAHSAPREVGPPRGGRA